MWTRPRARFCMAVFMCLWQRVLSPCMYCLHVIMCCVVCVCVLCVRVYQMAGKRNSALLGEWDVMDAATRERTVMEINVLNKFLDVLLGDE